MTAPSAIDQPARPAETALAPPLPAVADGEPTVYGPPFWFAYAANFALMMGVSMLFRFADFVTFLGGEEWELGLIVGSGMVGSLLVRVLQGAGIDRYGVRLIWLGSLAMAAGSLAAHQWIDDIHGPVVYLLQIAFRTGVAGAVGASLTFVTQRAPVRRMAEAVATLGTSGLLSLLIGPIVADLICGEKVLHRAPLNQLFLMSAALISLSLIAAAGATWHVEPPVRRRRRPPMAWTVRRYFPGAIMVTGFAMGIGIALPNTFLRPFIKTLGFERIGLFFGVYAVSAFATRILTRRLPARIGVRRTILWGLAAQAVGVMAFLVVGQAWHLFLPGLLTGIAHALLFPAIVAGGSTCFPNRYRGLGTSLMLATIDAGALIGAPLIGGLVEGSARLGLPSYPTMFVCVTLLLASAGWYYAWAGRAARRNALAAAVGEVELAKA